MALLYKVKPRVIAACQGFAVVGVLVIIGACLLHYSEGIAWLDCTYWALSTLSTVGMLLPHEKIGSSESRNPEPVGAQRRGTTYCWCTAAHAPHLA